MKRDYYKWACVWLVGVALFVAGIVTSGLNASRAPAAPGDTAWPVTRVGALGVMVNTAAADNARQAIQNAIDAVETKGGGTVLIPAGTYILDGELVVTKDAVRLVGESKATVLKAAAATSALIHFAASHGGVENLTLDGGMGSSQQDIDHDKGGVTAIRLQPRPPLPKDKRVHQNYNRFCNLFITRCTNGIIMQAGPNTTEGDSGCWYNVFDTVLMTHTNRGIWLKEPVGGRGSQVNRNQFYSVRIGQHVNTGIQIDSGDTNSFIGCSFEGIQVGTLPNKTPTAIIIKRASTFAGDNNNNTFVCARFEANTVDVDNGNPLTEFYASNIWFPKRFRGVRPLYVVGGYDPSYTPLIMPGIIYPEGSLPDTASQINFTRPVQFHNGATGTISRQ